MPSNIKRPTLQNSGSYFRENITPEPNLREQERSSLKASPSPPRSHHRAMRKFRFSALLMFALSIVSFILTLLITIAGRQPGSLEDEYMLKLNASHVGENIIRFERASSTASATPSATATSSSNPLDPLNPFSTASPLNPSNPDNPLNQLTDSLDPILGNLTDSINDGLGDAVNKVVDALIKEIGISDFYYMYTSTVCEGNIANGPGTNKDGVKVAKCTSYDDVSGGLNALLPHIQSSVVIAETNISVPIIAQLTHTIGTLSSSVAAIRRALFAFLIISMVGSGMATLLALPSFVFSTSRLLVYMNLFFTQLGAFSAFVAAILLTALIKGIIGTVGGLGDALNLFVREGSTVVIFVWVSWACIFVVGAYWTGVWFVEVRKWSFSRRQRSETEVGNWRGIGREVWRDLKGEKGL